MCSLGGALTTPRSRPHTTLTQPPRRHRNAFATPPPRHTICSNVAPRRCNATPRCSNTAPRASQATPPHAASAPPQRWPNAAARPVPRCSNALPRPAQARSPNAAPRRCNAAPTPLQHCPNTDHHATHTPSPLRSNAPPPGCLFSVTSPPHRDAMILCTILYRALQQCTPLCVRQLTKFDLV